MQKIILCAGISVRSGTNYMGSIFSELESVESLPTHTSKGEFPFFPDKTLSSYESWVSNFNSTFFAKPLIDKTNFAPYFSEAFIDYLNQEYEIDKRKSLFLKNPSLYNIEKFYDFFPNGKLIILTRSADDLIASSLKASLLIRKSQSLRKKIKSKLKYYSGYNMYTYSKAYVNHANQLLRLRKQLNNNFLEIKYEDLVAKPKSSIKQIFDYCELDFTEEELHNAVNAKVVGSSFYGSRRDTQNWGKLDKDSSFNPIGRSKKWNIFNKFIYNIIVKSTNHKIGY